jgi:hypothetical protein
MGKYKQLIESTIVEAGPIVMAARAALKGKGTKASKHQTRDWLVNKAQGAEQRGSSNRITSGNTTTNDTSNFNKEREQEINYNISKQGQPPVKDDDRHNEQVTQTGAAHTIDNKASNNKRFAAKVGTSNKVSDNKVKDSSTKINKAEKRGEDTTKDRKLNRLASVKNSARGVLGSIITNM